MITNCSCRFLTRFWLSEFFYSNPQSKPGQRKSESRITGFELLNHSSIYIKLIMPGAGVKSLPRHVSQLPTNKHHHEFNLRFSTVLRPFK